MCTEKQDQVEYIKTTLEQLVALIINQDRVAQGWLKYGLAIETALFAGYYYVFIDIFKVELPFLIRWLFLFVIPILGMVMSCMFCDIIIRERNWQKLYVQRVVQLPANLPPIFKDEGFFVERVEEIEPGNISSNIVKLKNWVVTVWLFVMAGALSSAAIKLA